VAVPSDFTLKTMNAVHQVFLKFGLFKKVGAMPVVELTTIGKKSGRPRTVLLTSPVQENGKVLVVASRGGDEAHPSWYTNLAANPEVTCAIAGGQARKATATTVPAEERERLWPLVVKAYRGYAGYQKRTSRVIPLVWLTPIGE
jgi:deazaflavin-dependent oxidoreductase (nitroreductase family)